MTKVIIELEFDRDDFANEKELKEDIYRYLREMIDDDNLDYEIED